MTLYQERLNYQPKLPNFLKKLQLSSKPHPTQLAIDPQILPLFPHLALEKPIELLPTSSPLSSPTPLRVAFLFSGGQAPGGHNVACGLFDALKTLHPNSTLIGIQGGPDGLLDSRFIEIKKQILDAFRNTGGFDLLGSGRGKIEKAEDLKRAQLALEKEKINALVIIGGDDSNTNAALLAEHLLKEGSSIRVIGVPKTIDGDLKNEWIETSFGFDTATKIYDELIGNLARDCLSAKKYTHFIRLMGRSASHVTLECALNTQPNIVLIAEEIQALKLSFKEVIQLICDDLEKRIQLGKNYGVILIPEGIIEFIADFEKEIPHLPARIQEQLMAEKDPHGNVQLSKVATEELFAKACFEEMKRRSLTINPVTHFFGYEGRSGMPSNFDCDYCYALGTTAAALIALDQTGVIATIKNLSQTPENWQPQAAPLAFMLHLEKRKEKLKPVIQKALVNLQGKAFKKLCEKRKTWLLNDAYLFPGPLQFFGPTHLVDAKTETLYLDA